MAAPLLLFCMIRFAARPMFMDRYMLPSAVAFAVVLAAAADRLLAGTTEGTAFRTVDQRLVSLGWLVLFSGLIAWPVVNARSQQRRVPINVELSKLIPTGVPTVVTSQWEWMQANFYGRSAGQRYFYVLDRELAFSPDSAIDEPFFYDEHIAWRNAGYWSDRIIDAPDFVCRFERFAVLDSPGRLWFTRRIRNNPAFTIESATPLDGRYFAVVHRTPGATLPNCRAE